MPIILGLTLILIFWFRYQSRRSEKEQKESEESFWQKEQEANFVRRKDIKDLAYIHLPIEQLPFGKVKSSDINRCEKDLLLLAKEPILNLTGLTNTDLKTMYGPANLDILTRCDDNFSRTCRLFSQWGKLLFEAGAIEDAITVLSYAVSIKSDVSSSYLLLGSLYQETGQEDKLLALCQNLSHFDTYRQKHLVTSLTKLLEPSKHLS